MLCRKLKEGYAENWKKVMQKTGKKLCRKLEKGYAENWKKGYAEN